MRTIDSNEKMDGKPNPENQKYWDDLAEQQKWDRMFTEFRFRELTNPCETCGRMPNIHPDCNCLVLGCCGKRVGSRCPDYEIDKDPDFKKVSEYSNEFGTFGIYSHELYKPGEKIPEARVTQYNDDGTSITYTYSEWKKLHPEDS